MQACISGIGVCRIAVSVSASRNRFAGHGWFRGILMSDPVMDIRCCALERNDCANGKPADSRMRAGRISSSRVARAGSRAASKEAPPGIFRSTVPLRCTPMPLIRLSQTIRGNRHFLSCVRGLPRFARQSGLHSATPYSRGPADLLQTALFRPRAGSACFKNNHRCRLHVPQSAIENEVWIKPVNGSLFASK
ncbi:MAG: hypothetical protein JWQ21_255 [Herminiimonas sp.]|nr:hypothetical protein [Herminiimonas sp.]